MQISGQLIWLAYLKQQIIANTLLLSIIKLDTLKLKLGWHLHASVHAADALKCGKMQAERCYYVRSAAVS